MNFTQDWFSKDIPNFEKYLAEYRGKPNLRYLEIGVFEGRSILWLLDNILTHETSLSVLVDPMQACFGEHDEIDFSKVKEVLLQNLQPYGLNERVFLIEKKSWDFLIDANSKLTAINEGFDCIYIDGSHKASNVLEDAILSFPLLKNGGIMIFDDYDWGENEPSYNRTKAGIDAFTYIYQEDISILHTGSQVFIKKS